MSAEQSALDPEGVAAEEEQESFNEEIGIDPRYEVVDEVDATGNLGKLTDPFIDMKYPLNEGTETPRGVIRNGNRWQARQHPDGSGVVESGAGTTTYGVRTAGGTVIGNAWRDFWFTWHSDYHQRREDGQGEVRSYDYDWFIEVPFRFVGEVLTMQTNLDLADEDSALRMGVADEADETFVEGPEFMRGVVAADILDDDDERGVLLTHDSGVQVYIGFDSTAHRGHEMFGFVPFDGENGVPAPSASDALDLLRPNRAAAAGGSGLVRQGEWFLVPTSEEAEGAIQNPGVGEKEWRYSSPLLDENYDTRHEAIGAVTVEVGADSITTVGAEKEYTSGSPLDSHIPRDWRTVVDDDTFILRFQRETGVMGSPDLATPQDCVDKLHEHGGEFNGVTYSDVREMAEGIEVRGTLRHRENEHEMAKVDGWRRATTHDWEVITVENSSVTWEAMVD